MLQLPHADAGVAAIDTSAGDIAFADWDDLFDAVKERLRLTACRSLAAAPAAPSHAEAGGPQASVLECVEALEQLHTTLKHELARRQQHERNDADAQTTRPQTRVARGVSRVGDRRARRTALHDSHVSPLVGRHFHERLDHALAQAESQHQALALLYLDLDGFKSINDEHGPSAGDELLLIITARLARAVRAEDMVSRMGDDEFACVFAGTPSRVQLIHLACKLFDVVSAPLKIGPVEFSVRPSIGIAKGCVDGATAETLLKSADAAMCRAKRHQTGYAFFDDRADVWVEERSAADAA